MLDSMDGVWTLEMPKAKPWRGEAVTVIEPKFDGWRVACFTQEDPANGLCVFGRKREAHLELSHFLSDAPWYKRIERDAPPKTAIDGELWVPGRPASAVPTMMRENPRSLVFTPFSVPGMSWDDARYWLQSRMGLWPPAQVRYTGQTTEELLEYARDWRAEGVVLKAGMCDGWYKFKAESSVDLVVTALKPGSGKYSDTVGSIHGSVWRDGELVEVACVSGMDDELRRQISEKDVGRPFECRFQYVAAGGRLRHPRFVRWRDDKDARECAWDQLQLSTKERR